MVFISFGMLRLASLLARKVLDMEFSRSSISVSGYAHDDVRARRVRLSGRVGMVDHHRLLVPVVHFAPHLELLEGVEAVEGRGTFCVLHGDEPGRPVAAHRAGDHAACLVRVVPAGVVNHLRLEVTGDRQHDR